MFSFKKSSKGFTLIELSVVVAIIALLAGTILVSLSCARKRALVSRVKSELSSLRAQGALYEAKTGHYGSAFAGSGTSCTGSGAGIFGDTSEEGMSRLMTDIVANGGTVYCFSVDNNSDGNADAWAVSADWGGGESWCVDSTGNSKGTTANQNGACN